ncbi:MAG: chromate transporter [Acidobacteria bacterium RIFCSPLOWO2_12_FULL_54_10]|nr:MAG: chromate transporter [Acidobacteria bacterium RIFCSPLOWO2_12_FULL_54_10]
MKPSAQGNSKAAAHDSELVIAELPLRVAVRVWLRVAALSFGGPTGQIAVMHRILVEEKKWISEHRFLHALNYCMLLPGPEAQQLATYIGWLLHRTLGGLIAGTLFVLPGFAAILVLSILYAGYHNLTAVQALFFGLKPAVLAVVLEASMRIGKRALKNNLMIALACGSFIGIYFLELPFPLIILCAGTVGFLGGKYWQGKFLFNKNTANTNHEQEQSDALIDNLPLTHTKPSLARALRILAICLLLWFGPLLLLSLYFGSDSTFVQQGLFFSKVAVVTFGGAYSVLAYVAQQAVENFRWLAPGEMLDGLGMAETTPGPLIMVLEFVGFLGAYRNPGGLHPMAAGTLAAIVTTWVTFVPCFLWIFLGAPYIESLRSKRSLNGAMSAITAAVVGVVLNLAVWFALHTMFGQVSEIHSFGLRIFWPSWHTINIAAVVLTIAAVVSMFRYKTGMLPTLAGSATLGMIYYLLLR